MVNGFFLVKTKELEGLSLVRTMRVVGAFPPQRVVVVFPLVRTRREVWFSPLERMVGAVPFERMLLSMMRVVGDFPLVRTMRVVGDFPPVRVETVVLVRLVSVPLKTEYSPVKSCV